MCTLNTTVMYDTEKNIPIKNFSSTSPDKFFQFEHFSSILAFTKNASFVFWDIPSKH